MTDGSNMIMPVAPTGGFGNGFGGGWGSDIWIILLVLFAFGGFGFGGMGGFGGFGGFGGYDFPWILASNANNQNATQDGFNNLATQNSISALQSAVTSGFGDVNLGIAGVNQNICQTGNSVINAVNGGFSAAEAAANARQIANLQQAFAQQTAMNQGFTGVNAGVADLRYTVATEACADRAAVGDALQNVTMQNMGNTNQIVSAINAGIQSIKDDLCADRLDAERRENQNLRTQLSMAQLAASQVAQTADIKAGQNASVNALVNELRSCPIPAQPVFGNQPIFQCNGGYNGGCGFSGNGFYN